MRVTLYGIPNCDQVKKARTWLGDNAVAYNFHDFKKAGISRDMITTWLTDTAWDVLVNRKGTTWRALSEQRKADIIDNNSATELMLEFPSIVKRPVLFLGNRTIVGFSDDIYQQTFK